MKFIFKAELEFEADDIDHCFAMLAYDFAALAAGEQAPTMFHGTIDCRPKDET